MTPRQLTARIAGRRGLFAGVAGTCEAASGGNGVMGTAKVTNGCGVYGFAGSVVPSTIAPDGVTSSE